MTARISYINRPGTVSGIQVLDKQVERFISEEKAYIKSDDSLRYQIRFSDGSVPGLGVAMIKVYRKNIDLTIAKWDLMGYYNALEVKRFAAELERVSDSNVTGSVELSGNLLENGLFNKYPDALIGWEISDDSTNGVASITANGDRMEISSTGTGTITITNTKTTLQNLIQYATTMSVHSVSGLGNIALLIGGGSGSERSVADIYNEPIISGGTEVTLLVTINEANTKFVLDYILINVSN